MNKDFLELCHSILSHYEHFPEVADTVKSVLKGMDILDDYPEDVCTFQQKRLSIISYIIEARADNIIYTYHNSEQVFLPFGNRKTILDDDMDELRSQLEGELSILIFKGIHQLIKRLYPSVNDDALSEELLKQDINTLQRYNIYHNEENA